MKTGKFSKLISTSIFLVLFPIAIGMGVGILGGGTWTIISSSGNDSYTKSLLHLNTDFTDSAAGGTHTWTAAGGAVIDGSTKKFGAGSLLLDGTGDYIDTPDSVDWTMGTGNFTIDYWLQRGATGALYRIMGQCDSTGTTASTSFFCYFSADNKLNAGVSVGAGVLKTATSTGTITDTMSFHHIAIVRNGDTLYLYIDGTGDGSIALGAGAVVRDSSNKVSIGRQGEYTLDYFNGYIDEVRISKGIARWTSNFTPPTVEYGP
jgi:hypothetical protein